MSDVFYTADLHLSHRMVSELRGFSEPTEHDEALAANWDASVRPDDAVWLLGDISVGGKKNELHALDWIAARPGVKHLITGNHDAPFPMRSEGFKWQRIYLDKAFMSVQSAATRKIGGQRVLLSHFPYSGDPDGDHTLENRFEEWRLPDTGMWLLHGHTHSEQQVRGRQVHVGLDAHKLKPVPQTWIEQQISEATPINEENDN